MKRKDIIVITVLVLWTFMIWSVLSIMPKTALEIAVEICEPYGGIKSISIESNHSVRFECANGEIHVAKERKP